MAGSPPPRCTHGGQCQWTLDDPLDISLSDIEARIAAAAEELLTLHEHGEIEWTDLSPHAVYELAFMDDD